ncbi:MAG: hypothetical protein AVDCRST_MAG61-2982, partial [uncultured Friedmanniella sp.]
AEAGSVGDPGAGRRSGRHDRRLPRLAPQRRRHRRRCCPGQHRGCGRRQHLHGQPALHPVTRADGVAGPGGRLCSPGQRGARRGRGRRRPDRPADPAAPARHRCCRRAPAPRPSPLLEECGRCGAGRVRIGRRHADGRGAGHRRRSVGRRRDDPQPGHRAGHRTAPGRPEADRGHLTGVGRTLPLGHREQQRRALRGTRPGGDQRTAAAERGADRERADARAGPQHHPAGGADRDQRGDAGHRRL